MIRPAFCLILISFLCWLAFSSPPRDTQWAAITAAYNRGEIGQLPPQQEAALKETVSWLAKYAQITEHVSINERPVPGRLNILTTTAKAAAITGCASGNAIYDRSLDVVFIDEHIAWPKDIPLLGESGPRTMYTPEYLGFPAVYLRFVLLHELGHRALHRNSSALLDANNLSRRMEEEADQFAINALRAAYADEIASGGTHLGRGSAPSLSLDSKKITAADRMWVDLLGAMNSMSLVLLYSASDFSSFYEDAAHPTFLNRASSIFKLALRSTEISERLKAHAAYHLENLRRTQQIPLNLGSEFKFPVPVQRVTFDKDSLITLTDHGHLYASPLNGRASEQGLHLSRIGAIIARGPFPQPDEYSWSSSIWVSRTTGPLVFRSAPERGEKQMIVVRPDAHGGYKPAPELNTISNDSTFGEEIASAPQPSAAAILGTNTRNSGEYWIIRDGKSKSISHGNWASHRNLARATLRIPAAEIDLMNVTDAEAYLTVVDAEGGRERLHAVMTLDLATNTLTAITPLRFEYEGGGDAPGMPEDRIVVVPTNNGKRYFLVTRGRDHFSTFELFESRPMHEVASQPFMLEHMPGPNATSDLIAQFDPKLSDAQWVPPNHIAVAFKRDSIYSINLNSGVVKRLFNPGDGVRMAIGSEGHVAFFMRNGYKVYTQKLTKE